MNDTAVLFDTKKVSEHYRDFLSSFTSTEPVDKAVAEQAIEGLYTIAGHEPPAIIWCRSMYQMLTLPSLLVGLLHSDIWELIAGDLTSRANAQSWNAYWEGIWPQVWSNGGLPLLTGMNMTSGLARRYGELETSMIAQAKSEFGKALHSGRLDNMQHTLKRDIYRRFWAPHAKDALKDLWVNLKNDTYTQWQYLQHQNANWPGWQQMVAFDRDAREFGDGVNALFDFLGERLGGEPRAQARFTLKLPAGLWWLGTTSLLQKIWPEQFGHCENLLHLWSDVANNCSAMMSLEGVVFLCERPSFFHLSVERNAHYENGPFLSYGDGLNEYAWQGVLVPKFVVEDPESITYQIIEETENAEIRRVMLERFGISRYITEAGVQPVQEDEFGTLFRRELDNDEPLVLLKVLNSTPEPDGSIKEYFLRVPPNIETAKQAVAWTFDIDPDTYDPLVQT